MPSAKRPSHSAPNAAAFDTRPSSLDHIPASWRSVSPSARMVRGSCVGSEMGCHQRGGCPPDGSWTFTRRLHRPHLYCGALTRATEFTSMLEGYEHVRAYCYNCTCVVFAGDFLVAGPCFWTRTNELCVVLGHNWNGHCITRWYVSSHLD